MQLNLFTPTLLLLSLLLNTGKFSNSSVIREKSVKANKKSHSGLVKYTVELREMYTKHSDDGGQDQEEEIYGAISVCLAAANYPPTVQLDYTYKNPPNKEINGGVEPLTQQSTNSNGRILWRQSDSKSDRRIHLRAGNHTPYLGRFSIGSKAVFVFDPAKDPYAAFRLFADMWESDANDDDEHINAGKRKLSVPLSDIPVGSTKQYELEIFDSSSRHYAVIIVSAIAGQ